MQNNVCVTWKYREKDRNDKGKYNLELYCLLCIRQHTI